MSPATKTAGPAVAPVLGFSAGIAATAIILTVVVAGGGPQTHVGGVSVWALAAMFSVAFAAAEAVPVHFELRRETISFSLSLIPLVVGLYILGPWALTAARLAGSALVLVGHRRQRTVKLACNLSGFWLETAVAVAVFRLLSPAHASGPATWPAVFAATTAGAAIFAVQLAAAISLYQRRWERSLGPAMLATVAGAIVETSLGVVAITLLLHEAFALLPLSVITALVLISYRTHGSFRENHRDLEQLYDVTGVMGDALRDGQVLPTLLAQAVELMHAEWAWVLLADDNGGCTQVCASPGGDVTVSVASSAVLALHRAAHEAGGPTLVSPDALGVSDVLAAPLAGSSGVVGTLVVGDRSGQVRRFSASDLRRLSALAEQATVAVENSNLMDRLRRQAAESEHQSLHDALTGLPNRSLFTRELTAALATGAPAAVLLLDLDRFKEVNDTLGHQNGDLLLQQVGTRLRGALRTGDLVARLGGDEFAVLLPDIQAVQAAVQVARGIVELLEQPFAIGDISVDVGASIGIAVAPDHGEDPGTLVRHADVAMYTAKADQTGVEVYRRDCDSYSAERLTLVSDLRRALTEHQLEVHYQPQIDLRRGDVIGVEALVRWNHPTRGRVQPDDFIEMAEHTGLIRPLTQLVLDEALRQCRAWRDAGWSLRVSVNLSARGLLQSTLCDDIAALLAQHGLPATALCLEITESSIMADPRRSIAVLESLRAIGVTIAVDDFGTGHSSLAYLKGLPVGELKIDKSFVLAMVGDESDRAIVQTIVDLARNLRLPVMAEGVEEEAAADRLREMGCQSAQGYYFGRPMPAVDLESWLAARPHGEIVPLLNSRVI